MKTISILLLLFVLVFVAITPIAADTITDPCAGNSCGPGPYTPPPPSDDFPPYPNPCSDGTYCWPRS